MVFSAGVELKRVSKESDEFQSWCKGGGGGGAPHPREEAGATGWRTRDVPTKLLDWLIPPVWVLLSLKKHCLLHSSLRNSWYAHFKTAFLCW